MTAQEIITAFELQVDDLTELSTAEELALLNRLYQKVWMNRPWEFSKASASGTLSTTLPYVSLPADFGFMVANHNYTGETEYAGRPVVFVGTNLTPYEVVSWSDRRQYRNSSNKCYVDIVNLRLYFTVQPTEALTYEFDYQKVPASLGLSDTPAFPARFHPVLQFMMATEDFVLQLSDKAKSYAPENSARAQSYLDDMAYWNANLVQM